MKLLSPEFTTVIATPDQYTTTDKRSSKIRLKKITTITTTPPKSNNPQILTTKSRFLDIVTHLVKPVHMTGS